MSYLAKIDSKDIEDFLNSWKDQIVNIGKVFLEEGDYKKSCLTFIKNHYAFDECEVLFKPTFTKDVVFRNNINDALSYFVSGDIDEDSGFAIKPWKKISISETNIIHFEDSVAVMGIFILEPEKSLEITNVAFTFVLIKTDQGELKIRLHHSSVIT
tara:strand:+ start:203 stop:670 length:468 start_codon:yes stop_codon:yes gene_type:complete